MISFQVSDMTCGHCVSTITKAVKAADPGARVEIDLAHHLVKVEPAEGEAQEIADAITEAGYTPMAIEAAAAAGSAAPKVAGGCCGGCR